MINMKPTSTQTVPNKGAFVFLRRSWPLLVSTLFLLAFVHVPHALVAPSVVGASVISEVFNGNNLNVSISTTQLNLPNGSLDNATVNDNTVDLFVDATDVEVTNVNVNSTGGGDAITLTALGLDFSTTYRMEVSDGVKDIAGESMTPFNFTFTTSANEGNVPSDVEFEKITVANGAQYTCLTIGPDGKLYGLVNDGEIHRWDINPDGTLINIQSIKSLQDEEGGDRLAIDITFDPASTAGNLIAWVSHSSFGFGGQPDWEGKITQLSGPNLAGVQDYVINLPRSAKDHVTNGMDFGPDGALYVLQGSNSAMGEADQTWSFRPERLLSAAVLRVEVSAITTPPLDVRTEDGGNYDPFAPGAPVTLFATGVRNAYDLEWHSNGQMYVPTNGSAAGGNTPATPGFPDAPTGVPQRIDGLGDANLVAVPGITGVSQTQNDQLFRCVLGGYYGHPNPLRGEYVLNGGNPTANNDPVQVNQYPVGTLPDPNWRGFAYNFQNNKSPNGVIEYQSNVFNGGLKGKILVVRYSGGDDIIVLTPGGTNQDIIDAETGISGFTGFNNPLDLTENLTNGHIYVSEYGDSKITLLRPAGAEPTLTLDKEEIIFSGFVNPPGNLPDDVQTLTLNNDGESELIISNIDFGGADAASFSLISAPSLPLAIPSGQSTTLNIEFDPANTGALQANLSITSNALNGAIVNVPLFGLGSQQFEGSNEAPMSDIIATLGYDINIGWNGLTSNINNFPLGDEVLESVYRKAGSGPVTIVPVARYSPAWELPFGYYQDNDDTSAPTLTQVGALASGQGGTSNPDPEHQTLFPQLASGSQSFDPGNIDFGFYTTSPSHTAYTEDALNALLHSNKAEHAVRIYELKDRSGNPVSNTYLMGFEEASNGDYQDYVFIISNIVPASTPQPENIVRINANGGSFTTAAGDVFGPDNASFVTGETEVGSKSFDVQGTTDDGLFLTYRFADAFGYDIPVDNGVYDVKLYFTEIFFGAPGGNAGGEDQRVFDVTIEDQLVLDDYDINAEVGAATAVIKTITDVNVADQVMDIDFAASVNNGIISAIELIPIGTSQNTPPTVTIEEPQNGSIVVEGNAVTLTATADDTEEGELTDNIEWSSSLDGSLGTGGTITPILSVGTHTITATVNDQEGLDASDEISITVSSAQVGDILYLETFWNEDEANDIAITNRGWEAYQNGGNPVASSKLVASKGLGKPANLQNINAGDTDPTPEDGRGFAAAFNNAPVYFFLTEEISLDLGAFNVSQISWYEGHSAAAETRVAIKIGDQWYVSNTIFTSTTVSSGDFFPNETGGAELQTFAFTPTAADWLTLNFTPGSTLSLGDAASSNLSGVISGFGLYVDKNSGGGFTARFDTYQINGTVIDGGNTTPVVANEIPDQSTTVDQAFAFQFAENTFFDSDVDDALTYTAVEQGEESLPNWLSFDPLTRTFSGTPLTEDAGILTIEVTATDNAAASVTDLFEITIVAPSNDCSPLSPALCNTLPVAITEGYCLEWDTDEGGLIDANEFGTGFTMVSEPSAPLTTPSDPAVPGYEPGNINISNGLLTLTATKGIFFKTGNNGNSQQNGLGVGFDADELTEPYEIVTEITNLPGFASASFQQAGLWFGLDEANYVKLVVLATAPSQYKVQLAYEANDDVAGSAELNTADDIIDAGQDVGLKLLLDPSTNSISGFYSVDGGETFIQLESSSLTLDAEMFEGVLLPDNTTGPVSFAGIHGSIRNASAANTLDFTFDRFCINEQVTSVVSPTVSEARVVAEVIDGNGLDVTLATNGITLPNGLLDPNTVNTGSVKLFEDGTNLEVTTTSVNAVLGDGDIVLTAQNLSFNTTYRWEINPEAGNEVTDITAVPVENFSFTFTTGTGGSGMALDAVDFERVEVFTGGGSYTCLTMGPDDKLYALTVEGEINRWIVNADGSLSNQEVITSLQTAEVGNRLALGLVFDPASTANNLIAYVSHSDFNFSNAAPWTGKITQLTGDDLENVQDYVINLPRAAISHATNQPVFGPDGALYFSQGHTSPAGAPGAPGSSYGDQPERLLSAAILRVDLDAITPPLNVLTPDGGGTYDPTTGPVSIYATGVRNAFDILWHSNGNLYAPTNGAESDQLTPEGPGGVPASVNIDFEPADYLFRIEEDTYYGHPNPLRNEFTLNGGNPTNGTDPGELFEYPVGTLPDPNWGGFAYEFGDSESPNGIIEYQSNTFGGALQGKMLVVRYNLGNDILVMEPGGSSQDIVADESLPGVSSFGGGPLDLVENTQTGDIYVAEYNGNIILLKAPRAVEEAELTLLIELQGRTDYSGDYEIELYDAANPTTLVATYQETLPGTGQVVLPNISVGTYNFRVGRSKYLFSVKTSVELTVGNNTLTFLKADDEELRGGDANGDNQVTSLDFSILVGTFNLSSGNENYNDAADINGDLTVSAQDFSILVSNFNNTGE